MTPFKNSEKEKIYKCLHIPCCIIDGVSVKMSKQVAIPKLPEGLQQQVNFRRDHVYSVTFNPHLVFSKLI